MFKAECEYWFDIVKIPTQAAWQSGHVVTLLISLRPVKPSIGSPERQNLQSSRNFLTWDCSIIQRGLAVSVVKSNVGSSPLSMSGLGFLGWMADC